MVSGFIRFRELAMAKSPWFSIGNGGMDPYDSPLRSPI